MEFTGNMTQPFLHNTNCPFYTNIDSGSATTNHSGSEVYFKLLHTTARWKMSATVPPQASCVKGIVSHWAKMPIRQAGKNALSVPYERTAFHWHIHFVHPTVFDHFKTWLNCWSSKSVMCTAAQFYCTCFNGITVILSHQPNAPTRSNLSDCHRTRGDVTESAHIIQD